MPSGTQVEYLQLVLQLVAIVYDEVFSERQIRIQIGRPKSAPSNVAEPHVYRTIEPFASADAM